MALSAPIPVRLNEGKLLQFEELAAIEDKPLGSWLREKLETHMDMQQELLGLRTDLLMLQNAIAQLPQQTDKALIIELLMLLRALAGPDMIKLIHAEMKRNNIEQWSLSD